MQLKLFIASAFMITLGGCQSSGHLDQIKTASNSAQIENTQVNITWHKLDKFHDIQPSNEHKGRFRVRLVNTLNEYIRELGKDLPKDVSLDISVTNLDLAGRVQYSTEFGNQMRIVNNNYWPKMSIDLIAKHQERILVNEKFEIKDMMFMDRSLPGIRKSEAFKYEKQMLRDWFYNDLLTTLNDALKNQ